MAGLVLTGLCLAGALLSWPAGEPREADAVVVLGGDGNLSLGRYARGRALVQAGYSRRLILFYPSADELRDARATVPEVVVVACMPAPSSWGEAQAVRERMLTDGVHSVLVVSDPPHMLRLDYTWGAVLGGTGLRYTLVATSPGLVSRLALVDGAGCRGLWVARC
ncbi:MAG: YdcF family protein [Comamonadaceae bacterium]|uniref:YdcF family protein n=1 Tax=Candidatus Skiveiella danica TaxID=3386177 RepID=UPI00390B00DA|nr:YdcF family protein [Comamonadaceae bacterium]